MCIRLIFVDDVATAARKLKGDFPGQDKEAKKAGQEGYEQVRASAQQYVGLWDTITLTTC